MLIGCKFSASSKVEGDGLDSAANDLQNADTGDEDSGEADFDTGDYVDPDEWDNDGDGYTEVEGDCDDGDADINPGASDRCDDVDNDCDELIDEDADDEDEYEPNDAIAFDLGELTEDEPVLIDAFLFDEDDIDAFEFLFTDRWFAWDELTISLTNLTPDITYLMTVRDLINEKEEQVFSTSSDSELVLNFDGGLGDDTAEYSVTISSLGGAGCTTPYLLSIIHE